MAARNRYLRIAMLALTSSYLLVSARNLIEIIQSFQDHLDAGFKIAYLVASVAFVVQAGGFALLAAAFGSTIDRRLLKIGGAIVASAFIADFVSTVVFLIPVLDDPQSADHRAIDVWISVSTGLAAIAVAVIAFGLLRSRRGPGLAPVLRIGLVFGALSVGAAATAGFHEWSLFTAQNYVHELTVGTLIVVITQIIVALFLVALAFGIRLPPPRRERWLTAAAAGVATATFAGVVGRALAAIAYGHKGSTLDDLVEWLLVGSGLPAFAAYAAIALGARSAAGFTAFSDTAAAHFPLARRNLDFWIAGLVAAAAYLILAGRYVLESAHRLGVGFSFGIDAASVINVVAALVGAGGWAIVATAFDLEVDWRRLQLGAALVASAYVGNYASWTLEVLGIPNDHGAFHQYLIWSAIGAFFLAGGALVVFSGLGDSKRGRPRGLRLQVGLAMAAASAGAAAVAAFELDAFRHGQHFSPESKIGSLAAAIAPVGVAFAALFFALEAGSPLRRREGMLTSTAALGAVAIICMAAGQAALAVGYSTNGGAAWVATYAWLLAAFPLVLGIAVGLVAFGARSARDEDAPMTSAASDQLAPEPA